MKSKVAIALFFAFVLVACLSACSSTNTQSGSGTDAIELEVGIIGVGDMYLPLMAAEEKGFFKEQGLNVVFTRLGANEVITALNAGSIPLAMPQTDGAFIAFTKGAPIRMVGEALIKPPYDLVAQPQYQSLTGLKGTTIGVPSLNNSITIMLERMLDAAGVKKGEYDLIATGANQDRLAALKSGAVSAVPLATPMNFMALDEGYVKLGSVADAFPKASFDSWWVNTNWSEKNRETVVRFLKAVIVAQQWVDDPNNKEEAVQLLMNEFPSLSREHAEAGYHLNVVDPRIFVENAQPEREAVDLLINIHKELGTFEDHTPPTFDDFYDGSYLEQAHKELGL